MITTTTERATKLFIVGSIGHLHPVIATAGVGFNIKTFKGQLNNVIFGGFKCPYFIIIVSII